MSQNPNFPPSFISFGSAAVLQYNSCSCSCCNSGVIWRRSVGLRFCTSFTAMRERAARAATTADETALMHMHSFFQGDSTREGCRPHSTVTPSALCRSAVDGFLRQRLTRKSSCGSEQGDLRRNYGSALHFCNCNCNCNFSESCDEVVSTCRYQSRGKAQASIRYWADIVAQPIEPP